MMEELNNLVVMISCMHEKDHSILERTNIQSDAIVINQCNVNSVEEIVFVDAKGINHKVHFICTTQRGLSKSRNMALSYAIKYDIALVCDDDEVLSDGYSKKILDAYNNVCKGADVISFAIDCDQYSRIYKTISFKMNFFEILRTSSQQISFVVSSIQSKGISFDEKMGSGTGNGPGEETMFLLTCRKNNMNMFYHPFCVAHINKGDSQWFKGYNAKYFQNQGWTDRRLLGSFWGLIYIFYWSIFRRAEYKKDGLSVYSALKNSLIGYCSKR